MFKKDLSTITVIFRAFIKERKMIGSVIPKIYI
jgi:hypothetical protein